MAKDARISVCGGRVIDPFGGVDEKADLLVENGRIAAIGDVGHEAQRRIDASGCLVTPGLIDMHVHLRDPGNTHKEDLRSGTAAAVAGGFTAVACMPNTSPPLDDPALVRALRTDPRAMCHVWPVGCLTLGRKGRRIADLEGLHAAGVVAFSDDGDGVADAELMAEAFERLARIGAIATQHCEDPDCPHGVMHEGTVSRALGLPGISPLAEEAMLARDLALCGALGANYHVAHISTARAVAMVRRAKARGLLVTTEVCPHHLLLTDESCRTGHANFKMHPPLRTARDVRACIEGVMDNTIDMLVTDHAPHTPEEKALGMLLAPAGVIGLECAVALFAEALVHPGHMGWPRLIELMSAAPARRFSLPGGTLSVGCPADVTVIDPEAVWTIDPSTFHSKGRNCPFAGTRVRGQVVCTLVHGQVRYQDKKVMDA